MRTMTLLVGLAFLIRPAAAVETSSFIYAEGGTDVAGGSITELDFYDVYYYGVILEAEVDSTLWVGEEELDYEYAIDPSDAEDTVSGDGGWGTYTVLGDHWLFSEDYGWIEVGETSAGLDLEEGGGDGGCGSSPACHQPTGEYSTSLGPGPAPGVVVPAGYYGGFRATLTGGNFTGDSLWENVTTPSQSCAVPNVTIYAPANQATTGTVGAVSADNTYLDTIGQPGTYVTQYYQVRILLGLYNSCNLFVNNQAMYDSNACDYWDPYKNITQVFTIYLSTVWITRDGEAGEVE
jgi:hypothetical protein